MDITEIIFEPQEGPGIPFTQLYEFVRHLGSGGFGDVFEVIKKTNGMHVAIKLNEYTNYIVMEIELCSRGSLKHYLAKTQEEGEEIDKDELAAKIMKCTLSAVEYLHNKNIVHRDIKPDNILLVGRKSIETKILESGIEGLTSELCGTLYYKAPEQILECSYSKGVDIWACGLITFEMINRDHPISGAFKLKPDDYISLFKNRENYGLFNIPEKFSETIAYDFFKRT